MLGFPVHHQLPELTQTHVHRVGAANPTISFSVVPFSSCPQSFSALGSFLMSQLFASGGQSTGVSASASILPVNIQDWFPLLLTGLISLQFKGLSRVFFNTIAQKHQFFCSRLSSWSNSHICILSYFLLIKLPWINDHNTAHLPVLVSPWMAPHYFVNRGLTRLYILLPSTVPGTWQALNESLLSSLTWQRPL